MPYKTILLLCHRHQNLLTKKKKLQKIVINIFKDPINSLDDWRRYRITSGIEHSSFREPWRICSRSRDESSSNSPHGSATGLDGLKWKTGVGCDDTVAASIILHSSSSITRETLLAAPWTALSATNMVTIAGGITAGYKSNLSIAPHETENRKNGLIGKLLTNEVLHIDEFFEILIYEIHVGRIRSHRRIRDIQALHLDTASRFSLSTKKTLNFGNKLVENLHYHVAITEKFSRLSKK